MTEKTHVETTPEQDTIPEDAQRLIDEAMQGVVEPEGEASGQPEAEVYSMEAAQAEAAFLVELMAGAAEKMHPALQYDKATRKGVADALAPVVQKYEGALPAWLEPWKEEIGLAIVLGGVAYGSVQAVKNYEPPAEVPESEAA